MSLRPRKGFTAHCNPCGVTAINPTTVREWIFAAPADAVRALEVSGWISTELRSGALHLVCPRCLRQGTCKIIGHEFGGWEVVNGDDGTVETWRVCDICDHVDSTADAGRDSK